MAPLFSKVDSNKLWHDVQHEENVICAKFGKDLFNISKVIVRKKSGPVFLTHNVVFTSILLTTGGGKSTDGICRIADTFSFSKTFILVTYQWHQHTDAT